MHRKEFGAENTRFAIAVTGHENDNTLSLWNASGGLIWTKTIPTNKAIGISLIKRSSMSVVGQTVYFNPSNIVVDSLKRNCRRRQGRHQHQLEDLSKVQGHFDGLEQQVPAAGGW